MSLRCADSRFAEPRNSLKKVLIVAVRSCGCGTLFRGLQNLETLQRGRFYVLFASCKKNQKARQRFANLWTPGTIQIAGRYVFEAKVTGFHQVTGNAEICNFSSIAGNDLNRCDAPALQHKIRANSKRTAVFFADSRLRVVQMGSGGQKRIALDSKKERFVKKKSFWFAKKAYVLLSFKAIR